jgi:AraC-like DNA-binding protein
MQTAISIGVFDFIMFLGIFQGLLLGWLFLKQAKKTKTAHLYQGILLIALALAILEEFLNNTGYIVHCISFANFAEPLNLVYGPLVFLYVKRTLKPQRKFSIDSLHFIIFAVYLIYMGFYFFQPDLVKYNSFIHSKHPSWPKLPVNSNFSEDPLGIRSYINLITAIHFSFYLLLSVFELWFKNERQSKNSNPDRKKRSELKFSTIHFIILIAVFIATKAYFERDLGDHFITVYITLLFFLTTYRALNQSSYFDTAHSFLDVPIAKYRKSSLKEKEKDEILRRIKQEMNENQYFSSNLASLADLSQRLNESTHHISQVINEKMHMKFYEMIAWYRVEEAKKILQSSDSEKFTIEDLAERVGYNSKSSFNTAFKKITGVTPSAYRRKIN